MKLKRNQILLLTVFLFCALLSYGQEEEKAEESLLESQKKDKSGTNPINFTYDYRVYFESQAFKDGGGSQNRAVMEFRAPLGRDIANVTGEEAGGPWGSLGSRWAVRMRAYYNTVNFNDAANTTVSGIGDFDARILFVAKANKKFAIAPGLEAFFNTATNDVIGSGSTVLAPVVFFGFFNWLGKYSILAPGLQHRVSIAGNDVNQSVLDLYYVKMLAKGKNWLIVNPQPVYDWENETTFAQIDVEWGFMIAKAAGLSGYIRPGLGVGEARPFNYNFEFAIKFIWR